MASTVGKLSATDRKSLAKITESRFDVLDEQLTIRLNEIKTLARRRVNDAHTANVEKIREALRVQAEERSGLELKHEAALANLRQKQAEELTALDSKRNEIDQEAASLGLKVTRDRYGNAGNFSVEIKNHSELVNEEYADVMKDYSGASLNLRTMKLQILEKIAVSGLESSEATEFLSVIPDIDNLLPPVSSIKELQ